MLCVSPEANRDIILIRPGDTFNSINNSTYLFCSLFLDHVIFLRYLLEELLFCTYPADPTDLPTPFKSRYTSLTTTVLLYTYDSLFSVITQPNISNIQFGNLEDAVQYERTLFIDIVISKGGISVLKACPYISSHQPVASHCRQDHKIQECLSNIRNPTVNPLSSRQLNSPCTYSVLGLQIPYHSHWHIPLRRRSTLHHCCRRSLIGPFLQYR